MRAFVTGATGLIGGRLIARLRERGDEVAALVRDPARARGLGEVDLVRGDLDDVDAIRRGVSGADAVFHLAAVYRVGIGRAERAAMEDANVRGTERVLDAATDAGVRRIVYVSTINTFGNTRGRVVDEDYRRDVTRGFVSWYDRTKYLAHLAAEERIARGAPVVVAMPGGVYGPGDRSEVGSVVDKAMHGRLRFTSFPAMGIVMCHVDDIAVGLLLVHDGGDVGRSYILGGEITTMREIVRAAAVAGGHRPPRVTMPAWAIKAGLPIAPVVTRVMGLQPNLAELISASDGVTYWASDARARRELGYAPRDLETGMRQLAAAVAARA